MSSSWGLEPLPLFLQSLASLGTGSDGAAPRLQRHPFFVERFGWFCLVVSKCTRLINMEFHGVGWKAQIGSNWHRTLIEFFEVLNYIAPALPTGYSGLGTEVYVGPWGRNLVGRCGNSFCEMWRLQSCWRLGASNFRCLAVEQCGTTWYRNRFSVSSGANFTVSFD